ncbi:MAG: LexA family protein [Thermodesulfobacteriota bacterium]
MNRLWAKYHKELNEGDLNWLLTGQRVEYRAAVSIPVLGRVPAGFPTAVEEDILEYITLPDAEKGCFAVIVHGESMAPAIKDGDYAIFIPVERADVAPGDVVVVLNEFGETMLKRYVIDREDVAWLKSDNPSYPSIRADDHHAIVGKVRRLWREIRV